MEKSTVEEPRRPLLKANVKPEFQGRTETST